MRNRNKRHYLSVMAICTILVCHTSIVHGTDQNDFEKDIEKTAIIQNETDVKINNNVSNTFTGAADINDSSRMGIVKTEKPTTIPDIVDYTCRDDILFKFNNGTSSGALENITEVIIFTHEDSSTDQKNDAIITLEYKNGSFSYDLEKGELILKNDALKESIMIPGKSYFVEVHGYMVDGTPLELEKPENWIINYINAPELNLNEEKSDYMSEETEHINLFSQIDEVDDHPGEQQHVLDLANTNTSLSAAEIENLIGINQTRDIIIHTNDRVTFTFLKGSMKLVDGKEAYDFGVELIADCQQSGVEMPNEDFVFRIKYHNTGELPGTAQVSIPVGNQWAGQEVFYAAIDDRGILYMSTEIVDTNGIYTIPDLWFTL